MMTHTINAHELKMLADVATPEGLLETHTSGRENHTTTGNESDDGVEALIISMDRTTAEHVFLQAQRDIRRDAARALLAADH
jgi:hypothetical protein